MEFRRKQIINLSNGMKIGYADDLIFDDKTAEISAILVYGRFRLFGLLGREDDLTIDWKDIDIIGEDAILVKAEGISRGNDKPQKPGFFEKLFL